MAPSKRRRSRPEGATFNKLVEGGTGLPFPSGKLTVPAPLCMLYQVLFVAAVVVARQVVAIVGMAPMPNIAHR